MSSRTLQSPERPMRTTRRKTKECPICCEMIQEDEYFHHMDDCGVPLSPSNDTGECPMCYKKFPIDELLQHASACADNYSRSTAHTCFRCSMVIEPSRLQNSTIHCPFKHTYCLSCLQETMNDYINSNTSPVCNFGICNYELSRYDVCCLPLNDKMIKRLLSLIQTTKRPKCPSCLFYIQMETIDDFTKHTSSCSRDNVVCQHCNCLISIHEYDQHEQQCHRTEPYERKQTFYNFILSRTQYPITMHQLRFFLEKRREDHHQSIDAREIVDALDVFDGIFPYEIPLRVCDICAESFVYDDIFVVGCDESHKLCYDCFAESTTNQMRENQILKCAMCDYQLADGEIKQLRVSAQQKEKFLDYQSQRTFNKYAGSQGVLKCPNKDCKWIVELENPNSRFRVKCPLCEYEFCSLCSQQYHYRTTCQQLPELTQRWFFWCDTERGNHWKVRARQDATFRVQLQEYEKKHAANEQRNNELRQRYNELVADEQYKAQNCRLCPHCRRVVQRIDGCDSMICGRNYHGGDQQSGCGKGFNWLSAATYTPMTNRGPQLVKDNLRAPTDNLVVHEGVQCDFCHNEVHGIRFDCVHCRSLIFCEKCEQNATLDHANEIRAQNKPQHVFQVITTV